MGEFLNVSKQADRSGVDTLRRNLFRGTTLLLLLAALLPTVVAAEPNAAPKQVPVDEPARRAQSLQTVENPPQVQMLVPGFAVRQLPIELTNINNVRYRHDGTLVALAYNGNVYLLTDTDGDGLEDSAALFWDNRGRISGPVGMALTPPGYERGTGLFIPSHGKVSLVVDTDGDDRADSEIIIANDWEPLQLSLDAVGAALADDGSLYFGLGTADYSNPYLLDKETGEAHYDIANRRGTIIRVSPDFKQREIVCTGIRWPVSLAIDRDGELFCTDQEGATWLANGNPFDELLHIQQGRHYGFPPRHPKHLPDVIDEPSLFDYGPQHQSTCGLFFNRPVNGGPVFGPDWWEDDAFVCGFSRGKLYRTKLVRSSAGYTATNQLVARLAMLTADACVAPDGGLVVTVHSGGPDWGTGPDGTGKLYKLTYENREQPQVVAVYPSSPNEVRIEFHRPLEQHHIQGLAAETKITYGKYVRAGDRFESFRPGYAVVELQNATPRYELPVHGVQVTSAGRALLITTEPHPEASHYAVTLPWPTRSEDSQNLAGSLAQHDQIDLHYDLTGVVARWEAANGKKNWDGWLPHADLAVARAFTAESSEHERLWKALKDSGTLSLRTRLDLKDMLRPAVQPASTISYSWPPESASLVFRASCPLNVTCDGARVETIADTTDDHAVAVTVNQPPDEPLPIEIELTVNGKRPELDVAFYTAEDERLRPLPLRRFLLPWAAAKTTPAETLAQRDIPELGGGNWARGEDLFFGETAKCGKCHRVRGRGADVGPDLSNLVQRDYVSVLRDVTDPSFAINPDFMTFTVVLNDGRILKGPVRTVDGMAHIADANGNVTIFHPSDVEKLEASRASIMPDDLAKTLTPAQIKDLLSYLLIEPPSMPVYGDGTPPPPRHGTEVEAVLRNPSPQSASPSPLNILLVAGKKDHGPGEHDYPAWQDVWSRLLSMNEDTTVTSAWEWPSADDFKTADVIVFYQHGTWTPSRASDIDAHLARGGGLVYIHYAVDGGSDAPDFARRIGLAAQGSNRTRYRHGPLELSFAATDHPIARNFDKVRFYDESYWQLAGDPGRINLLATGVEEDAPQPLFWTVEETPGRVFVSIPGHYSWTFDDPLFRTLLLRGIAWAAGEQVDRFNNLVTAGARVAE